MAVLHGHTSLRQRALPLSRHDGRALIRDHDGVLPQGRAQGSARDAVRKLRDEVYAAMTARAEKSECDLVTYVRAENADRAEAESAGEAESA